MGGDCLQFIKLFKYTLVYPGAPGIAIGYAALNPAKPCPALPERAVAGAAGCKSWSSLTICAALLPAV